jgi:hypothetical protein
MMRLLSFRTAIHRTYVSRFVVLVYFVGNQYHCNGEAVTIATELASHRHNIPPLNKNADIVYPVSQESEFMLSPCKPERNGYFGATYGEPTTLQYGFEIESNNNADISDALDSIRENVMDTMVSVTFPTVCSFQELSTTTTTTTLPNVDGGVVGITGLYFGQDFDAVRKYKFIVCGIM